MRVTYVIVMVLWLSIFGYCFVYLVNKYKESNDNFRDNIGIKVCIDKDTLTVTDYSVLLDKYYLSNGADINSELLNKLKTK